MRWIRRAASVVLGVALLAAFAYAALVAVNRVDEPLSAEARAFIEAAELRISPAQNGYFAILGWRSAPGADPHRAGLEAFEHWRRASGDERRSVRLPSEIALPAETDLCSRRGFDCLSTVAGDRPRFEKALAERAVLMARLTQLASYPRIHGPRVAGQHPDEPVLLPPYHELWKLGATHSALRWLSGHQAGAVGDIAQRAKTARRAMRDAGSALDLVLAELWLRSEIGLVAELMAHDPRGAVRHASALAEVLQPLAAAELHSSQWLHGEFSVMGDMIAAVGTSEAARNWLIGETLRPGLFEDLAIEGKQPSFMVKAAVALLEPLFQPGATTNLLHREFAHTGVRLAAAPSAHLAQGEPATDSDTGWLALRNPVGRAYMASRQRPRPWAYIAERHDLDRFIRLCRVQLELLRRQASGEAVGAFLAASAQARDPATGKPVNWDAAQSRLWVPAITQRWGEGRSRVGPVAGQISLAYPAGPLR